MAKAKANPITFDWRKWTPLTDVLRRILPRYETCAEACREVERAIRSGQVRWHLQQGHFPDFAAPPLPPGEEDWIKRSRIEWSGEHERAEIWSVELLELYKKLFPHRSTLENKELRPGTPSYRDFFSLYIHKEDEDRLWSDHPVNQAAGSVPFRRKPHGKPGPEPQYDWDSIDAEMDCRISRKYHGRVPENLSGFADEIHEWCTEKWGYNSPARPTILARIRGRYLLQPGC